MNLVRGIQGNHWQNNINPIKKIKIQNEIFKNDCMCVKKGEVNTVLRKLHFEIQKKESF